MQTQTRQSINAIKNSQNVLGKNKKKLQLE